MSCIYLETITYGFYGFIIVPLETHYYNTKKEV